MSTRKELLNYLWSEVINSNLDSSLLNEDILDSKEFPASPFAVAGPALERMLAKGVDPKDICLIKRSAAYSAVFSTLYSLDDPGVEGNDVFMLHEELLSSDPSGLEGKPGSANVF